MCLDVNPETSCVIIIDCLLFGGNRRGKAAANLVATGSYCDLTMNKRELLALLQELGLHPSRRLGQNFLLDRNLLSALVRDADLVSGEHILEVGPGTGVLTAALLASGCRVTAIELDHRLASYVRNRFASYGAQFHLLQGDACRLDLNSLVGVSPYRCISNLPYSCSSPFMATLAALANPPTAMHLLLQKEMAERLTASPGSKDYGAFTVRMATRYQTEILRLVPPEVFYPAPEVTSAFVRLRQKSVLPAPELGDLVSTLAGVVFSQRRKKSFSLLAGRYSATSVQAAFDAAGLSADVRAAGISPEAFFILARHLSPSNSNSKTKKESPGDAQLQ